jgi:CHAT domain-containing protein
MHQAIVIPDGALHLLAVRSARDAAASARLGRRRIGSTTARRSRTDRLHIAAKSRAARATRGEGRAEVLSVSTWRMRRMRTPRPPCEGVTGGGRCPRTANETGAIRRAFGDANVEVLSGSDARESAVRAAMMGPRYLHLATHGFAEVSGGRLDAGLVLAPSPGSAHDSEDDGVLELFEIHRLALGSDLAVLSACESGKGMRVAGEGAFALSRGFLAAGTRRVVASLWAVDDEPTSRVVGTLFETIAASEHAGHAPSPALALRDAKRNVRENPQWADPFYWAAFSPQRA